MSSILVSIVIPIYKVEKYINQCIDSVLEQTYENIEVILVDDGSPDKCPQICEEYAKRDKRVKVIHQENNGSSAARNAGIDALSGEYVMFLDGDDFFDDSNAISRLIERICITNPDVLNYSYKKYYEDEEKKVPQFLDIPSMPVNLKNKAEQLDYITKEFWYIASACNKMIRKSVLSEYMRFEKGKLSEDVEWCARLLCCAQSFDFVCENFYCYRQRSASITHTMKEKACMDLTTNIQGCMAIAERAEKDIQKYLYRYTAYQLATFVAVQARATKCPPDCIQILAQYQWLFSNHGSNKKVTCLYFLNKIVGFETMCKLIRRLKCIWS